MNGQSILQYLKELCHQLDQGIDPRVIRKLGVTLTLPAAALLQTSCPPFAEPDYGAPFENEDCTDGYDNDYDGYIDCDDSDCRIEACLGCFDGIDNDGVSGADCGDSSCAVGEGCQNQCDNGIDNDGDGQRDCADYDCAGSPDCP